MSFFLILFSALGSPNAHALIADPQTSGSIYVTPQTQKNAIFRYSRTSSGDGASTKSSTSYFDRTGKVAAEEFIVLENNKIKTYRFQQHQIADLGEAKVADGKISFTFTRAGKTISKTEPYDDDIIAPDMIQHHIQTHWDQLANYQTNSIRLLVIERAETIGFEFYKEKSRVLNGKKVTDVIMKPSNFFLSLLVKPARLTFESEGTHKLLEFQGRLPLRNPENFDQVIDAQLVIDENSTLQPVASTNSFHSESAQLDANAITKKNLLSKE